MEGNEAAQATEPAAAEVATPETGGEQAAVEQTPALPEGAPEWAGPLFEQVGAISEAARAQAEANQQESGEQYEGSFSDQLLYDDDDDDDDEAEQVGGEVVDPEQQRQVAALQQLIDRQVQEQIAPIVSTVNDTFREQAAVALEAKFPELQKPEVAGPVVQMAKDIAAKSGHPELAKEIWFVEQTYMAAKAKQMAASETPAVRQQEPALETAAAPGGGQPPNQGMKEEQDAIVNSGTPNIWG